MFFFAPDTSVMKVKDWLRYNKDLKTLEYMKQRLENSKRQTGNANVTMQFATSVIKKLTFPTNG